MALGGEIPWISIQLRCHLHEERDALKPPWGPTVFFDLKLTPRKVVTRYFSSPGI